MRDDRLEVLAQVREACKSALLPSARATIPPHEAASGLDPGKRVEQFVRELDALGVKVYYASTPAEATDTIVGLIRSLAFPIAPVAPGLNAELLAWQDSELLLEGLGEALGAAGIARLDYELPADPAGRRARLAKLERATAGLTGALAGLADSGTLVLSSGPGRPRLASLLPPVHIAVVARALIYATMADFFSAYPSAVREASNLVFITGPSRTGDIEQTLTLGVHGPREVHVVLVG